MKQENKELLLRDLCSRLPYGVIAEYYDAEERCKCDADIDYIDVSASERPEVGISQYVLPIEEIKPYLFPMSSMTEKKVYEFYCRFVADDIPFDDFVADYWNTNSLHKVLTSIDDVECIMDWYNENHVDCHGLIYRDLANDATGLSIY